MHLHTYKTSTYIRSHRYRFSFSDQSGSDLSNDRDTLAENIEDFNSGIILFLQQVPTWKKKFRLLKDDLGDVSFSLNVGSNTE